VYLGLEELGYPWANRAVADKYGPKEKFIAPRYDPYANPWEPKRRSGADGHAVCIIGHFHSRDFVADTATPGGWPVRDTNERIGNVFVTKETTIPCGWNGKPWTKSIAGKKKRPPAEFAYALLPVDMFTKPMRDGGMHRRRIMDGFTIPMGP